MPCKHGSSWCLPLGLLPAPGWSALCLSFQNQRGELWHENYHCMKSSRRQSGMKYLYIFSSKMMSGGTEGKPVLQEEWEWGYPMQSGNLLLVLKQCRKGIDPAGLSAKKSKETGGDPDGSKEDPTLCQVRAEGDTGFTAERQPRTYAHMKHKVDFLSSNIQPHRPAAPTPIHTDTHVHAHTWTHGHIHRCTHMEAWTHT